MITSRCMRQADYEDLSQELTQMKAVQAKLGPRDWRQHMHRDWEYALAIHSIQEWAKLGGSGERRSADIGCGAGIMPAILLSMGFRVDMYDNWSMNNRGDAGQAERQAQVFYQAETGPRHRMIDATVGAGVLTPASYEVVMCISTIEHVPHEQRFLGEMVASLKPGGLFFMTFDFAEDGTVDRYANANLRSRIYDAARLCAMARALDIVGVRLQNGYDWSWHGCMVNDHSFGSVAFVKENRQDA